MGLSYEEYLAKHPVSPAERAEIDAHKQRMLTKVSKLENDDHCIVDVLQMDDDIEFDPVPLRALPRPADL